MQTINWQQFGLKTNPYDTLPLVEGGDLPIEQAFVGRDKEMEFIDNFFDSENRVCLTMCGDVGVGKTSLTNFQKFVWKYKKQKLLFSFRREIEASVNLLDKKSFLIEIMGSILREIELIQPELLKNDILKKISQIVDISQMVDISAGVQIFGCGGDFGKNKDVIHPVQLSNTSLEKYFVALIKFIKENEINGMKYSGLIVHVNNFDTVLNTPEEKKQVIKFFGEIRDLLQTPSVYFLFLGPRNFFKDIISSQQRVKSIFIQTPLQINPLSKKEIVRAFDERMQLLRSDDVKEYIKPVVDEVIFRLYDIYQGDIRSIMSSVRDILSQCSIKLANSLSINEAMLLLGKERWEKMNMATKLTEGQIRILKYLIENKKISQKEASKIFNIAQSNVSGHYFRPLKEADIIEEKERVGNMVYWGLTTKYLPLQWLIESQKQVQRDIKNKSIQPKLF